MAITYKDSGVDIEAGESLVDWLKGQRPSSWPHQERLVSGIGGFSAVFRAGFPEMSSPCLVSATDGVGTKLKVASYFERYEGLGQDLVAMCVNDLICCGASPLFFLDYYACGKLDVDVAKSFLAGLQKACVEAHCALIGGETAEMPGVYSGKDFDCAGFAVGVVDEAKTLGVHRVQVGDSLLAVTSSGFHSNGYSLLRRVFEQDGEDWREALLTPTRLYVKLIQALSSSSGLHGVAHITGGGMDNLLRVLPSGVEAVLTPWEVPAPFLEVKKRAGLDWVELLRTLNCGVGLVLVVDPQQVDQILQISQQTGYEVFKLGTVQPSLESTPQWHWKGQFKDA